MQYGQRKLQRSITEMRRSANARPSASGGAGKICSATGASGLIERVSSTGLRTNRLRNVQGIAAVRHGDLEAAFAQDLRVGFAAVVVQQKPRTQFGRVFALDIRN